MFNHRSPDSNVSLLQGDTGIVVCAGRTPRRYGVSWDKKIMLGHGCGGYAEHGHGWYVFPSQIKLCETDDKDDSNVLLKSFELGELF